MEKNFDGSLFFKDTMSSECFLFQLSIKSCNAEMCNSHTRLSDSSFVKRQDKHVIFVTFNLVGDEGYYHGAALGQYIALQYVHRVQESFQFVILFTDHII